MLLLAFWCEGSDEYMFPSQNVVLYIYTPAMETSSLKALSIWLVDANYIYLYIVNLICLCQISFSLNMFRIVCQNHFKSQDDVDILFTVPFCMLVDMDHKYPIYRCFNFLTFQALQYTLEDCWNQKKDARKGKNICKPRVLGFHVSCQGCISQFIGVSKVST